MSIFFLSISAAIQYQVTGSIPEVWRLASGEAVPVRNFLPTIKPLSPEYCYLYFIDIFEGVI
jgi:hypothetical protein